MPIQYINRSTGAREEELVYGDKFLKWVYESDTGSFFLETLVKRKLFSFLYGKLQDTPGSRRKIKGFVQNMHINMSEAKAEDINSYRTFNAFFTRELKPEARPVPVDPDILIAPADGKILAWENINIDNLIQVKGSFYTLADLLQDKKLAMEYAQGICLVIRLCPTDYHRFHFPDSGIPGKARRINGHYYSVNPLALRKIKGLYCENKRELTILDSDHFGEMLLIEVGATCVGSIVQTYRPGQHVRKGSEKGYFKFGGSTMILVLKKDAVKIDTDILFNTSEGLETTVKMGERIGSRK